MKHFAMKAQLCPNTAGADVCAQENIFLLCTLFYLSLVKYLVPFSPIISL